MLAPDNNRGMTYQTDEKHLTNYLEYFVGVVNLAFNCYDNHFVLHVFTNNILKYVKSDIEKTRKMSCLGVFDPPRLAPYHSTLTQFNTMQHYPTLCNTIQHYSTLFNTIQHCDNQLFLL